MKRIKNNSDYITPGDSLTLISVVTENNVAVRHSNTMAVCPVRNSFHFDSLVVRVGWRKREQFNRTLVFAREVLNRPGILIGLVIRIEQQLSAGVLSWLGRAHVL